MSSTVQTNTLRGDILGGVTAGVVALPLALAFGEASGLGPMAGLWGAIIVGFFAAFFGGTNTQVSGPTGPMVVVFAASLTLFSENPSLIFASVILAGVFLMAFGFLGFGKYIRLVPYSVVSGFMSGIGCIIILLQLPQLLGIEPVSSGVIGAIEALASGAAIHWNTLILGAGALALVFLWPSKIATYCPGALGALIICTLIGTQLSDISILGAIPTGLPAFSIPTVEAVDIMLVLKTALVLAALCAIDSLLTSLVADKLTQTRHEPNKELIGQGAGNLVAGFFGALPGAGATMRTVVNIRSGGQTRLSGVTHSILLFSIVLALSPLASKIPHAVLAGILIKVGYDIIDWEYLRKAHLGPKFDFFLMLTVLFLTVFFDLILAVGAGVVIAALTFVKKTADNQLAKMTQEQADVDHEEEKALVKSLADTAMVLHVPTPLSFGAAADLTHFVREQSGRYPTVIIHLEDQSELCLSAAKAIETIAEQARAKNRDLIISGVNEKAERVLSGLGIEKMLPREHWFGCKKTAMRHVIDSSAA